MICTEVSQTDSIIKTIIGIYRSLILFILVDATCAMPTDLLQHLILVVILDIRAIRKSGGVGVPNK